MHSYLRSVGFSELKKSEVLKVLEDVVRNYDEKTIVPSESGSPFVEYSRNYGCDCGITVCGELGEDNKLQIEYYYPYFRGNAVTTQERVSVERHAQQESYAGACDDLRIGVTLIFYLQKAAEYMREAARGAFREEVRPLTLTGLASDGTILLPIEKNDEQQERDREWSNTRSHLIAAAKNGDEEAIENLTMEDLDTYSMISQRIHKEDVLTIVESYFMPYGMECDHYNVMGEILDMVSFRNIMTGEKVWQFKILTNDVELDVCVNDGDLLGEPEVGRRFKGVIWLQGQIHF